MKRIISLLLCIVIICCACGSSDKKKQASLDQGQLRSIAELATLECYYHNVAEYTDENTSGWWLWSKDSNFWIEYEGIVKMGVDASKIKMNVKGNTVSVTIPKAKLISAKVNPKTFNKNSFYIEEGTTKPNAKTQIKALKKAQEDMKDKAKKDTMLLVNAQSQAQTIIEKYINNIGKLIDKDYHIEWEYIEN